jgi:hypothetical protein
MKKILPCGFEQQRLLAMPQDLRNRVEQERNLWLAQFSIARYGPWQARP